MTATGEKVHPRSMKQILIDNAKFEGKEKLFWATPDYMKTIGMIRIRGLMFRYMYALNKKGKKLLKSNNWNMDYPKEKDLKWKQQIEKGKYIEVKQPIFSFENAEINKKNINQCK